MESPRAETNSGPGVETEILRLPNPWEETNSKHCHFGTRKGRGIAGAGP
jgi:hypothetical protein